MSMDRRCAGEPARKRAEQRLSGSQTRHEDRGLLEALRGRHV